MNKPYIIVVGGVSGSGKTTVSKITNTILNTLLKSSF